MRSRSSWIPPETAHHPRETVVVTPGELSALKSGGNLDVNVTYEVPTSEATGNVVYVYATTASTVSHEADYYDPAVSAETLPCHYDCSSDRIDRMWDPVRDVEVSGSAQVNNFPWGTATITESIIDQSTFNYTSGTVRGLRLSQDSVLTVDGGDILEVDIENDSTYSQTGGYLRYSKIFSRSRITNSGTNILDSSFSDDTVGTFSGGTYTNNKATTGARITQSNGAILECTFSDNALIRFTGTGRIYYSNVDSNGLLYADTWSGNFYYNTISNASSVSIDGTGGNMQRNSFDSYAIFTWRNGTADLYYNSFSDGCTGDFDNSAGLRVRNNNVDSSGFLRIENATAGTFQYSKISSRGYFLSSTGYTGAISYLNLHSNGQINNANNFSGNITQTEVGSRARLYATDFSGRIIYSSFSSFSYVYLERSAMDIYAVSTMNAYFYVRDAVAGSRVRDLTLMSYARFYGQFMGATGYVNRCTLQSYGLIYARNGAAGTLRYCNVSGGAYFNADNLVGTYQRSEAHAYARVTLTQPSGTSSNNNYTTNAYTISVATSNDVQGY